jgi:arylsulfatase A-like enzyme
MDAFDENDNAWDRWAPPIYDDELYLGYLRRLGVKTQRYKKEIRGLQQDRRTPHVSVGGWIEQSDGRAFPMEAQYTHYLVRRAIEKVDAALTEPDGRPIYLQLDIFDPHQPFSIPAGLEEREKALRGACSALPKSYADVQANQWKPFPNEPKVYDLYRRNWGLYEPDTLRDYRTANALQMEVVDRALAGFIDALKQRGLYDESILVFTSDHGEMNGRRALVDKGVYLYPDVLRVPLAVKMPKSSGVRPHTLESPVCHLDLAPTLLSVAGVEPLERLDGQSLLPHIQGTAGPAADRELFFECGWHVGVNFACATQKWTPGGGHHLYSYNAASPYDELYDLTSPDAENLAASPGHKQLHSEMVSRLGAMLERDSRWIGYNSPFRIDHYFDLPKPKGDVQMFRPI